MLKGSAWERRMGRSLESSAVNIMSRKAELFALGLKLRKGSNVFLPMLSGEDEQVIAQLFAAKGKHFRSITAGKLAIFTPSCDRKDPKE